MVVLFYKEYYRHYVQFSWKNKLDTEFTKDVNLFIKFLQTFNGVTFFDKKQADHQVHLYASLTGLGSIWQNKLWAITPWCGPSGKTKDAQLAAISRNILMLARDIHISVSHIPGKDIAVADLLSICERCNNPQEKQQRFLTEPLCAKVPFNVIVVDSNIYITYALVPFLLLQDIC